MDDIWGPISLKLWKSIPCLSGRVANENDVLSGRAVFFFGEQAGIEVTPVAVDLPRPAILTDDGGSKIPVIVIQAESADGIIYVGYRLLDGGNGICLMEDVELLIAPDDQFSETI